MKGEDLVARFNSSPETFARALVAAGPTLIGVDLPAHVVYWRLRGDYLLTEHRNGQIVMAISAQSRTAFLALLSRHGYDAQDLTRGKADEPLEPDAMFVLLNRFEAYLKILGHELPNVVHELTGVSPIRSLGYWRGKGGAVTLSQHHGNQIAILFPGSLHMGSLAEIDQAMNGATDPADVAEGAAYAAAVGAFIRDLSASAPSLLGADFPKHTSYWRLASGNYMMLQHNVDNCMIDLVLSAPSRAEFLALLLRYGHDAQDLLRD